MKLHFWSIKQKEKCYITKKKMKKTNKNIENMMINEQICSDNFCFDFEFDSFVEPQKAGQKVQSVFEMSQELYWNVPAMMDDW